MGDLAGGEVGFLRTLSWKGADSRPVIVMWEMSWGKGSKHP